MIEDESQKRYDSKLLFASGAAYAIKDDGHLGPDNFYRGKVGYINLSPQKNPVAIAGRSQPDGKLINACLVGRTDYGIVVAFRGTIPKETIAGIEDWINDFLADTVSSPPLPGKVHYGFDTSLKSLYNNIKIEIEKFQNGQKLDVYVTGHSKGGGIAPLCAWRLWYDGFNVAQVVTFAAPRCGDANFANKYEKIIQNSYRYENFGDLAPLVPPSKSILDKLDWLMPYLDQWLQKKLREMINWNYTSVSHERFIMAFFDGYAIQKDLPPDDIAFSVLENMLIYEYKEKDKETALIVALASAHSIQCNSGYMMGVCGKQDCKSLNEDVARIPAAAPPPNDYPASGTRQKI